MTVYTVNWQDIGGNQSIRKIADVAEFTLFVFPDTLSSEGGFVWQIETRRVRGVVEQGWESDMADAMAEAEGELHRQMVGADR